MNPTVEINMGQLSEAAPVFQDLSTIIKYEIMWEFRNEVIRQLHKLDHKKWFKNSKGRLFMTISGLVIDDKIIFYSTAKHFIPQERGVKPHTMWYLLGKTIPLKKEGGTLFRKCTLKSIMNGGWRHPGYEGKNFMGHCINIALERLPHIVSSRIFAHTGVIL